MLQYQVKRLGTAAREAVVFAVDHGLFHFAKSTSYSALLCLVPVTTSMAAFLADLRAQPVARLLTAYFSQILPPGTADYVFYQVNSGQRPWELLVIALIFSIVAASSVVTTLMDGFNAAYAIPPRPFLRQELLGIALVFLCAVPLMLASSLVLFGDAVGSWLWHMTHAIDPALKPLAALVYFSRGLHGTIALAATALLTALLYRYAPNRNQPWMQVWPGAILSTVLWLVMTLLFRWYVRNISNYNVLYGSVGTSMALLIWMYLLSAALLVGCEFNAALERGVAAAKEFRTAVPPRREVPVP